MIHTHMYEILCSAVFGFLYDHCLSDISITSASSRRAISRRLQAGFDSLHHVTGRHHSIRVRCGNLEFVNKIIARSAIRGHALYHRSCDSKVSLKIL